MGCTDDKVIGSDEGIKLVSTDGKLLVTILGNVYGITLGIDVETDLGSLDGSFDRSNDSNIEGLLLGDSMGCTDGKVLGYNEGIRVVTTDSKVFVTIIGNVDVITLGLDVETEL